MDLIVNYEQIADTLPPFEHSGIWDEAMLADVDLHLRFDDVMVKAAEVGEVYGEVVRKRDQENYRTSLTRFTTNISRLIVSGNALPSGGRSAC